jgi:hypothetical protein
MLKNKWLDAFPTNGVLPELDSTCPLMRRLAGVETSQLLKFLQTTGDGK